MSDLGKIGALPAVMPADVRNGSKEAKEAYGAAVGFERMLVKQLTKSLSESSAFGGGENGSSPGAYREMVSDGIADAISQSGGMGLAEDLYRRIHSEDSK
jgi:Rod binding domain-containing protein